MNKSLTSLTCSLQMLSVSLCPAEGWRIRVPITALHRQVQCVCLDTPSQQLHKSSMGAPQGAVNWLDDSGGDKLKQHAECPDLQTLPVLAKDTSTSTLPLTLPLPLEGADFSSVYSLFPVKVPVISSSHCSAPEICCHPCDAANCKYVDFFYIFVSWAKTECNDNFSSSSVCVCTCSQCFLWVLTHTCSKANRSHCEVFLQWRETLTQFSQSCLTQQCMKQSPKPAKLWF